jgi:uncharacterized protein (DUF1800 family)
MLTRRLSFLPLLLALAGGAQAQAVAQAQGLTDGDARRFLAQASFGPTAADVTALSQMGRQGWVQKQFTLSGSDYVAPYVDPDSSKGCPTGSPETCKRDNYSLFPVQLQFFQNALSQPDQLRQRTALALSQILVVSGNTIKLPNAMANYQRIFLRNAFGNYRDILKEVTLSPAMGRYLNMANNAKANPAKGIEPNENYAREVLQLFSIGLWELSLDGTTKTSTRMTTTGLITGPIPAYDQDTVEGFAHAFTGWTYAPRPGATKSRFGNPSYYDAPMIAFEEQHDTGTKKLLSGVVLPGGQRAAADLDAAITNIFNHPNVGPFIGRQLIQQLVTANPSPAYVARVASAFNASPRGDMKRVLMAILTDPEASTPTDPSRFGKLREPIVQMTHLLRSMGAKSDGLWPMKQMSSLSQPVFSPPSVFSFFPPDYDLPVDPSLDGPAFGVFNASSAFKLSSVFSTALSGKPIAPDTSIPNAIGTSIDLTPWVTLAVQPASLVAEIKRVMFGGRMSVALESALLRAAQISPVSKPLERAKAALFLAAMSPEYLVEN